MSNYSSPGGWRERTKRTNEKAAARADMADTRAARAAMEAENARLAEEVKALEAKQLRLSRLRCPCCDGDGTVTPNDAERIYRAFERLPSESRPDPEHVASLAAIALRLPVHGRTPRIVAGVHHPAPVAHVEPAPVPAEQPVAAPQKSKKTSKINRLTEDGALIELED